MENYAIYCTNNQTEKAFELGAPIDEMPMCMYGENETPKYVHKNEWNRECFCYCPTAEQMIGWLEEQGITVEMVKCETHWFARTYSDENTNFNKGRFFSRKEATLAAIDAALDYLNKTNK